MLSLFNTLTRKIEPFEPLHSPNVGMYTCGPTVYNYVHIGNLRAYVFEDILHRVLKYNGYQVNHVMNITDVGHLTDDADQGEDKIEKGSRREGKTAWEIASMYTDAFKEDMKSLNLLEPNVWCKATDHITEQVALVETLIEKGYTYETSDGIYFDTTRLSDYGKLARLDMQTLKPGARVDMGEKKNPHDFALWKFTKPAEKRQMEWTAFGRQGFPGWHVECSAMSMKYLGNQIDIHCGGVDHIPVHHTNEIAQSEAATEVRPWVRYWLHNEFLLIGQGKMAKSGKNFITLKSITDKGFEPLGYRYFLLQTHYRKQLNFTWEALEAAQNALKNLRDHVLRIPEHAPTDPLIKTNFKAAINDDLNTPMALAITWDALKANKLSIEAVIELDKILGLNLHNPDSEKIPANVQELLSVRAKARLRADWEESDRLRKELDVQGYKVEDTNGEQRAIKI